jgi:hypothetical protein
MGEGVGKRRRSRREEERRLVSITREDGVVREGERRMRN